MLYLVLKIPAVQNYITGKISTAISKELDTKVVIGGIDLDFFLDVIFYDFAVYDRSKDTLVSIPRLRLDIKELWLTSKQLEIAEVSLDGAYINLMKHPGDSVFNYMFLADYFSGTPTDSTKKKKIPWKIQCSGLNLKDVRLRYSPEPGPPEKGFMNFWNLDVTDINAEIRDISTDVDTISASITHMSLKEHSGFSLKDFSTQFSLSSVHMHASSLKIKTEYSDCELNLDFNYPNYDSYNHFEEQVKMTADIKKSKVSFADISYFAGYIDGMTDQVMLSGKFVGTVTNFATKNIEIDFGERSVLKGDFSMTGLPGDAFIYYNIKDFRTNVNDISNIPIPPYKERTRIDLPEFFAPLGDMSYKGIMSGFFYDFVADGYLKTGIGNIDTDLKMTILEDGDLKYKGNFETSNLDVGFLTKNSFLGHASMKMNINGQGIDENVTALLKGDIKTIDINGYNYQNIVVDGEVGNKLFNGTLNVDDQNLALEFDGQIDFGHKVPLFNFVCEVEKSNLDKLNILTNDTINNASCSGRFIANFTGGNIESINGVAKISDFNFVLNKKKIDINNLSIVANESPNYRTVVLKSDIMDANISGKFDFDKLEESFNDYLSLYLPAIKNKVDPNTISKTEDQTKSPQKIDFNIQLKNFSEISNVIFPSLNISKNAEIQGHFNSETNDFACDFMAKSIGYNGTIATNADLIIESNRGLKAALKVKSLDINNRATFKSFTLGALLNKDTLDFNFLWNNNAYPNYSGNIKGKGLLSKYPSLFFTILPSEFTLSDTLWRIAEGNMFCLDSTSLIASQLNLTTNSEELSLAVDGKISESPSDSLFVRFNDFSLSNLNFLTVDQDLTFSGQLNGKATIANVYKNLFLTAGLKVAAFKVNNDNLGSVSIESSWNQDKEALDINAIIHRGELKSLIASGFYFPYKEKDNLDINIEINKFKPQLFEHYLDGYVKDLSRKTNLLGNLKLKGTLNEPEFAGEIQFLGVGFRLEYTNCFYQFSDKVRVEKNGFYFDNLTVEDTANNFAKINGSIKHRNFKDFVFDINIDMDHFQALNTDETQNELFYGTTVASGKVKITGTPENTKMDIAAKTEKDTRFFLPLNTTYEITDNSYITFVEKTNVFVCEKVVEDAPIELTGIEMNFDLEVTPEAEIQIIMDEKIGDIIKARGNANLKLAITTLGDFSIYGDYNIESGDYLFTLQNVFNKHFDIEKGSMLKWTGDPYEGVADIKALYSTRTSLKPLRPIGNVGLNIDTSSRRMPVECLIEISDKLFNPKIDFDILFPSLIDEESKRYYQSAVNVDLTRQVFSLLVINSFTVPSNLDYNPENQAFSNNAVGSNSSELLTNQLNNWLSQMSTDFDLGVVYRAGDQINSDEIEVAMSKQFLDDRLTIDGNFGVAGKNQQNASNIVGDVNIEYKITKDGKIRVKAYNKTNSNTDLIRKNAPYTQGVGLFYRKEFDRFKDIFKKKK